ncbi:sensor histidine kinase [Flaviaesturariibacter amylovorans]|uniref:Oxygen sensor histidine kinase NreB n=1 Tax=Flaviaesturariibacter amylovorans TaxID=1084520 RepID=A0ABP8H1S8_9BACT
MRKAFFPGVFVLCSLPAFSQKKIDSLHALLRTPLHDTMRLKVQVRLGELHARRFPDSTIYYSRAVLAAPDAPAFYRYKVQAANALGMGHYFKSEYPPAAAAFAQMHLLAEKDRDRKQMAIALNNEGNIYIETGEHGRALERYRRSLVIREALKDSLEIAMAYNNIGFVYKDIGDYEKAATNFLVAMKTYERMNRSGGVAMSLNNIGIVFFRKKDYTQALEYYLRALALHEKNGNRDGLGISLIAAAAAYTEQGRYDDALPMLERARVIYEDAKDARQLATVSKTIGDVLLRRSETAKAVPYLETSLSIDQRIGNRRALPSSYLTLASALVRLGSYPKARPLIDSATALVTASSNNQDRKTLYEVEAEYHQGIGEYARALTFAQEYNKQKDALLNEANVKSLNDLKVKYETEKKEAAIALLTKDNDIKALAIRNQKLELAQQLYELTQNKLALSEADLILARNELQLEGQQRTILKQQLDSTQRVRNIRELERQTQLQALEIHNRQLQLDRRTALLGLLGAVVLLGSALAWSFYRRRRLAHEARLQAAILREQELATKAILEAEEAERQRIAKDLHDGVGQMMSAARMNLSAFAHRAGFTDADTERDFGNIISLVDDSCREVRHVSHNMMPNALLKNSLAAAIREFIGKLDHKALEVHLYTEGLDERLDANVETVLYRVIQESVNNVIKHSGATTLDISVVREPGEISATIEDNGRGFVPSADGEGMGLRNMRTRVGYLKGTVDFDSRPGEGTLVAIHVPL